MRILKWIAWSESLSPWRSSAQNVRTPVLKPLQLSGIKDWPRLYHNMRLTRQTELLVHFPTRYVCEWLWNPRAVEMKHFGMATGDSFQRAICCSTSCSISANQQVSGAMTQNEKPSKTIGFEGSGELVISSPIGPAGLEPATNEL